jgi:hypothetical protein
MKAFKHLSPRVSFCSSTGGELLLDLNVWPALIISSPLAFVGGFRPTNFRRNTCCPVLKILFVNLIPQKQNHGAIRISSARLTKKNIMNKQSLITLLPF